MTNYSTQHELADIYLHSFDTNKINRSIVLDLGCGDGYAATRFLNLGALKVFALDKVLKDDNLLMKDRIIYFKDIEEYKNMKYDIIWNHHVVEHVANPIEFLKMIYDYLNDDGELWIACPNMQDHNVFSPGHIHNYLLPNLMEQMKRAGFKINSASWWFHGGQLRIRVSKSCINPLWPKPCQDLLDSTGRIDTDKLPEKWNW